MTTAEVQRIRNLAPQKAIIEVFCDNAKIYYAGNVRDYAFYWDDANACFYQLRPNVSAYTQVESPLDISMVPYENIQSMVFKVNLEETMTFLTAQGLTIDQIKKELERLTVISGKLKNTTHIQTSTGYADGYVEPKK